MIIENLEGAIPKILGTAILMGLLSSCAPVSIPTTVQKQQIIQKQNQKGTSTKTPFLSISTYTSTSSPAPTWTTSTTPIPNTATSSPTSTMSLEPSGTSTIVTPTTTNTLSSPTATNTPKIEQNSNPDSPQVKVSVTTNCRTGPGINYPKLTALQSGKQVNLIGRDANWTYWIIKDPGKTGKYCWLWGYYASTIGNTKSLKVYNPPTPPGGYPTSKPNNTPTSAPPPATAAPLKTPRPSKTNTPSGPTNTPNLTPATSTNTSPPPTATPIPPTATPIPDTGYCSDTSVLPGEEDKIRKLINQTRAEHGLPKLIAKSSLVAIARDHGRDMTCHGTYSHTSTDGTRAWERISVALGHGPSWCYNHCCCSEIFYGGGSPQIAFNWWMTHPSQDPNYKDNIHKRTILSQYSTHMGVGAIYYQKDGLVRKFYTVDFARP